MSCKLSVHIFDNKPKLFLWGRFNEHLQTTFDSFCPANLKFRGWRPDFGKILFNVSTGTTLHCALISILQDIVVQSENIPMGKICPILSNTDKSFWGLLMVYHIKEKFPFISKKWFSFCTFNFFKWFCCYSYDNIFCETGHLPRVWEILKNLIFY